jgi:heme A synthase
MEFLNGITFGQLSATLNILFVLLITSYLFNRAIENEGNRAEGQDWKLVVIGVFYTQVAIGVLDTILPCLNAFILGLIAYCVSGFPMAYGAHMRHKEVLRRVDKALNE